MVCEVVIANTVIIAFRHNKYHVSEGLLSAKGSGSGEAAPWGAIKEWEEDKGGRYTLCPSVRTFRGGQDAELLAFVWSLLRGLSG